MCADGSLGWPGGEQILNRTTKRTFLTSGSQWRRTGLSGADKSTNTQTGHKQFDLRDLRDAANVRPYCCLKSMVQLAVVPRIRCLLRLSKPCLLDGIFLAQTLGPRTSTTVFSGNDRKG